MEKAQLIKNGTFNPNQAPAVLNLHSPQMPHQPAHAFSEQTYQINMILHPIHIIVMSIRQGSKHHSSPAAAAAEMVIDYQA